MLRGCQPKQTELSNVLPKNAGPVANFRAPQRFLWGGARATLHCNHTVEIDLFFLDEWVLLTIVDIHTLWTRVIPIVSKKTEVVLKALLDNWFQVFPPPKYITLDSGGEFFSDFRAEQLTNVGITPNYTPKGSHAFASGNEIRF